MPCMCGDPYCPSCGPAQGNYHCPICGKWSADGGCDHNKLSDESGGKGTPKKGSQASVKNQSRYSQLDVIAEDPRVSLIWDEGEDGIWVELTEEWEWEGCSCVHEWKVTAVS